MNPITAGMIRLSGRSWWQAKYKDGRVVSEWDTLATGAHLPLGRNGSSRWEEVPKNGMVNLRLLCPNGMAGELEAPEGYKFFQLKAGGFMVGEGHFVDAHIIGVVKDAEGACLCRAWDYHQNQLIEFTDNIYAMKYLKIGRLNLDVQQLKI